MKKACFKMVKNENSLGFFTSEVCIAVFFYMQKLMFLQTAPGCTAHSLYLRKKGSKYLKKY